MFPINIFNIYQLNIILLLNILKINNIKTDEQWEALFNLLDQPAVRINW